MRNYLIKPLARPGESALRFRPVSADALLRIAALLHGSPGRACDYTVGGIFMWADYLNYRYCIAADTLFIEGSVPERPSVTVYALPVGAMAPEAAVDLLRGHCRSLNRPLRFSVIPEDRLHAFACIPGARVSELAGWGDYIYDIRALVTLAGNAMKKKRNHVNRFLADNPRWTLDALTADNAREAMDFLWRIDVIRPADSLMAQVERRETYRVLEQWKVLSPYFHGAILRDDFGRPVAFTVGEIIGDTLFVHIEKMDHGAPGAGEMVNHAFASSMAGRYPQLRYVNREDDSCDSSLRAAKLSWHPERILPKFSVDFPHP